MKMVFEFLLALVVIIGLIGFIILWFYGVPQLAYMVYDGISYPVYLSIWLSIHLVRNIYGRVVLQNKLKQYAQIDMIIRGGK